MDSQAVKAFAVASGFTEARICRADEAWEAGERLAEFVAGGQHGGASTRLECGRMRSRPSW